MRIPIAIKLIIITASLLIAITISIAVKSSEYFANEALTRDQTVNTDYAKARGIQIENILSSVVDKTKASSISLISLLKDNKVTSQEFELNFNRVNDFVSVEVLQIDGTSFRSLGRRVKTKILEPFHLDENYISDLRSRQQIPYRNVIQGQHEILNGSFAKGPPMFTIAIPLLVDAQNKVTHIAVADFLLSSLQKPFIDPSERTFFLVDKNGTLLAHSDEQKAISKMSMSDNEIFKVAQKSNVANAGKRYTESSTGTTYYASFSNDNKLFGVIVFSQIPEEVILEAAKNVKREAYFIAGMILSGSIFLIFLFSMSLTSPIETLAQLIQVVSKGNFDVKAKDKIKSLFKDEVGELAIAFDNMTDGLKERDKVKSLFSKFHGSSVTDDLMSGEVGLGGQKKDVVVFFSDIRGFTAFSEKRAPEEVVAMLNEYFGVMVGVINKHNGVVDKFIGDAIMAVWGVPKNTDHDTHNALRACIEMRKALAVLNEARIARGQTPISIGMGLHAGDAISGTIGSDERMEYTIIGNTVNTGSRIEASTKAFGTDLLISDTVLEKVGDEFLVDYAGAAEVKGRSEPLKLYKVRGYKENGQYIEVKTAYSEYEAGHVDKVKVSA